MNPEYNSILEQIEDVEIPRGPVHYHQVQVLIKQKELIQMRIRFSTSTSKTEREHLSSLLDSKFENLIEMHPELVL